MATEYPCLVDVTPGCVAAGVRVTAADPLVVNEGRPSHYTVVLDFKPTADVSVTMRSEHPDMLLWPVSLDFTPDNWQTAQTVTVRALHDDDEEDESAIISHTASGADEYAGIAVASVAVAIIDDDALPTLSVNSPPRGGGPGQLRTDADGIHLHAQPGQQPNGDGARRGRIARPDGHAFRRLRSFGF